jgi:hypothetical protein
VKELVMDLGKALETELDWGSELGTAVEKLKSRQLRNRPYQTK